MDVNEIEKRIEYVRKRLVTLKQAISDYRDSDNFERYKCLKTIERDCEEIIESSTRINQEILGSINIVGETYRDSFEKLKELDVFDDELFLTKIANTTGFRNRLAHDYIDLDEEITIKTSENILNMYPKYLLGIVKFLKKS